MKHAFRLRSRVSASGAARLLFSVPFTATLLAFPGGCGTNAGNPFVESDDGDSSNFSGRPSIENPAPNGKTDLPPASGGEIIVAKNDVGPQPSSAPPAAEAGKPLSTENNLPKTSENQGGGTVAGSQGQPVEASASAQPVAQENTLVPNLGVVSKPIDGISKSAAEIVAEVNLSSKACKLASL